MEKQQQQLLLLLGNHSTFDDHDGCSLVLKALLRLSHTNKNSFLTAAFKIEDAERSGCLLCEERLMISAWARKSAKQTFFEPSRVKPRFTVCFWK